MSQIIIMAAILIYLAAMLGVGFYCSKQNNSVDDFYLGGRKLGPFVTAMSAEASDMSSWLLMGLRVLPIFPVLQVQHGQPLGLQSVHMSTG